MWSGTRLPRPPDRCRNVSTDFEWPPRSNPSTPNRTALATTALLWVDRSYELLERSRRDLPALAKMTGYPLRRLIGVSVSLSDPHHGNAAVHRCRFEDEDGLEHHLVYKPKDIRTEGILSELVEWLILDPPAWV